MKLLTTVLLILAVTIPTFATTPAPVKKIDWPKAEKNYVVALASENSGVRESAVGFLSRYKLQGAVEPLIGLLRSDRSETMRMAAAAALMKIGNKDGVAAVKEASELDGSEKVAKYCEHLLSTPTEELSMN